MARFLITSGSYFEPFSYDELAKPLEQMAEAQNTAADNYDQLSMETEALRRYISDNKEDERARKLYDDYVNKLNTLQDNLWRNGYNSGTRRDLASARSAYASDITRLKGAIENRQARSKEYWDTKHKNPDMIMGDDPGMSGLDNFLDDDLYGSNWYSYSGTQFMSEVGADAKARANEMLNDPQIMRDPRLAGYITRITQDGFTSDEVNRAAHAVRMSVAGDDSYLSKLDPASAILASVLTSHLASTGAMGNVSNNEYNRLIDYGVAGLSQAIGQKKYEYMNDKAWDQAMDWEMWKRKQDYSAALAAKAAAAKKAEEKASEKIQDTDTRIVTGPNANKADKKTRAYDTDGKNSTLLIAKNGLEIHNKAEASELVYGGDIRRRAYQMLGFDIGRDTTPNGVFTTSDKFLSGTVEMNGKTYETRFNPNTTYNGKRGAVQVREGNGRWLTSPDLTNVYYDARQDYEDNLKYYRENEEDVARLASIDPDRQAKDYKRFDTDFLVPMTDFKDYVMHLPENSTTNYTTTYIARNGTDPGEYVGRFSDLLSASFKQGKDWWFGGNDTKKDPNRRQYTGTTNYIHKMTEYGTLENKAADPDNVFEFDKERKITNIHSLRLSQASILGGYIIADMQGSGDQYAINIDMINSDAIRSVFEQYGEELEWKIRSGMYSEAELNEVVEDASRAVKDVLGYFTNTQSQSGSSQENRN